MKVVIGLLIIIARIYIGFKILQWIFLEMKEPQIHSISEIELYLVFVILDVWISIQPQIEIDVDKRDF